MKKNSFVLIVFAQLFLVSALFADIRLPAIFTDHMVLQRNSEVTLWGWGQPGETVSILVDWQKDDTVRAKASNAGKWAAKVKTIDAGGPYTIRFMGTSPVTVSDVMLGEVWVCSGQSNMEWSVNHGIFDGEQHAAQADCPNLRIFQLPTIGSSFPQENCFASWALCSPETMRRTSAIGYFFGRSISEEMDVPVGIIVSAWGGTPAEVWLPGENVHRDPVLSDYQYENTQWWPIDAGALYNSMIHPVMPYGIAGCIWYQGESNHSRADSYGRLMHSLIGSWRSGFNKDFPFYLVQIAPHKYQSKGDTPALLREQQAMLAHKIQKVAVVSVADMVDNLWDIHPRDKRGAGLRLSYLALEDTYGKFVGHYRSPEFLNARVDGQNIVVSFSGLKDGLKIQGDKIVGLKVAGENMDWIEPSAKIVKNQLVIYADAVKGRVSVRYCFDDDSVGTIFSTEGVPVLPFRVENILLTENQ